jgi:hypothetical protein
LSSSLALATNGDRSSERLAAARMLFTPELTLAFNGQRC